MTKEQFIEFVGRNARRAMAETGVPASVTVAQAILETGWGKHTIGEAKNLFGIKGRGRRLRPHRPENLSTASG
jgi:flagellum-specific peptidoglycan hydrolase FlgJ